MFCPDQVGLTRFIKYLTWIMHWIKYVNNGDELSMLGGDDGCVSPNFPWKNQLTVQSKLPSFGAWIMHSYYKPHCVSLLQPHCVSLLQP